MIKDMKSIRKVFIMALTFVLLCLLAACGEQAPSGDTMETKAQTFTDDTDGFEPVESGDTSNAESTEETSESTEKSSTEDAVELPKIPI